MGAVASPLLANIALSALDEHFAARWDDRVERAKRRRHGLPNYRLIRYADDFVVMVSGTKAHAQAVQDEVAAVLSPIGLRLSEEKTDVVHIDEGLDFLGWRIQRHAKRGTAKSYVYTYPSKKALGAITEKVRTVTRQGTNLTLAALLQSLNPVLRGWTNYFRAGVSSRTFEYLRGFVWRRVMGWLRRKHRRANWKQLRRRYCPDGGGRRMTERRCLTPARCEPLATATEARRSLAMAEHEMIENATHRHGPVESRMLSNGQVRFGERAEETHRLERSVARLGPTPRLGAGTAWRPVCTVR